MEADREQVCSQQFHGCYNEECMQMLLISEKVTSSLGGEGASVRLQESHTGSSWLSLVTNQMKHA